MGALENLMKARARLADQPARSLSGRKSNGDPISASSWRLIYRWRRANSSEPIICVLEWCHNRSPLRIECSSNDNLCFVDTFSPSDTSALRMAEHAAAVTTLRFANSPAVRIRALRLHPLVLSIRGSRGATSPSCGRTTVRVVQWQAVLFRG